MTDTRIQWNAQYKKRSANGKYVQLECGHYVYEYEAESIAEDVKEFLGT